MNLSDDSLRERLHSVKLLALDVDGVLTDCRIWLDSDGEWRRTFSIRDGWGIKRLQKQGYKVGIITASTSADIRARVKSLALDFFYEGASDKQPSFEDLQKKTGLKASEMAYVGDDLPDMPLLKQVSFAATPPEAMEEVKEIVHYVTRRPGGNGAVREVCDLIFQYGALK